MAVVRSGEIIALDANFLVAARATDSKEAQRLEQWLRDGLAVEVSAVAWSEYLCGPAERDEIAIIRKFITTIVPFAEQDAALAGALFNDTGRRSRSHADCMIAAHAIHRGAILATRNLADFRAFKKFGLKLV